ncbi:hypothetical protein ACIQFZ_42490 [Streptomyces sp. NPDC093064]
MRGSRTADASKAGGSQQAQVKTSPEAPHRIKVHSGGGNVSVMPAG